MTTLKDRCCSLPTLSSLQLSFLNLDLAFLINISRICINISRVCIRLPDLLKSATKKTPKQVSRDRR